MFGYFKKSDSLNSIEGSVSFKNSISKEKCFITSDEKITEVDGVLYILLGKIFKCYDNRYDLKQVDDQSKLVCDLYNEVGNDFVKLIDGHFQVIILDKEQVKIFQNRYLAFGIYYFENNDYFIFSSKFEYINDVIVNEREIDKSVLRTYLSNGWNPTEKTLVKGINKLLPTIILTFDDSGINISDYWSDEFKFDRQPFQNLESHLDMYEKIYQEGIENFLDQNPSNELGTLLSGGHDTSFTLIEGSKVFGKPMHSFTATFPGWAFDEGSFAQNISKKFKAHHHAVPFTPNDIDYIVGLIVANEEPVVGSSLPVHLCAMEAKNHVDNMMAGDGGDTLWGEYFPVAEYHSYVKNLPTSVRKFIYQLAKGLRKTFDWERFWELEHVAELFAVKNPYDDFLRRLCTYRHFSDEFQRELLVDDFFGDTVPARSMKELQYTKDNFSEMLIESKLYNGFYTYQSYHTHRSMNHFGMELYLPTINREFMQFITNLPIRWVNGGTTFHRLTNALSVNRRFHKKVLARYLKSEEIYNRSFDVPWYNILRPRTELLNKLKERLIKRGWYNEKALNDMFDEFMHQKVKDYELLELKHHGYRIFTLLSLEIWCIEYLDGRKTKEVDQKITLEDYLS